MGDYIKRPKPPTEISFLSIVAREWDAIRPEAEKGRDASLKISIVERILSQGRKDLEAGHLRAGFDWELDLAVADSHHAVHLRWLNSTNANNAALLDFWKGHAKWQLEVATAMMISGVNLILGGHGAAAIAALHALFSDRGQRFETPLLWTIFAACIGLLVAGLGKILIVEWGGTLSRKITSKLAFPTPLRLRAIGRYVVKVGSRPSKLVPWLLYGSIVWFAFYVFVAAALIAHR